jgi:hypothetical protein
MVPLYNGYVLSVRDMRQSTTGEESASVGPGQAAIFRKDAVIVTSGVDELVFYDPNLNSLKRMLPCKVYYGSCRAPIFDEGRNMLMLFPSIIQFGRDEEGLLFDSTEVRRRRAAFEPTYV